MYESYEQLVESIKTHKWIRVFFPNGQIEEREFIRESELGLYFKTNSGKEAFVPTKCQGKLRFTNDGFSVTVGSYTIYYEILKNIYYCN